MAADDDLSRAEGREAHVVQLLQQAAHSERAPASLRAEIDDLYRQAAERRARRRFGPQLLSLPIRLVSGGATVVAAVVVALVIALGGAGGPSIAAAAAVATRGPSMPAPATDPASPSKLDVRVGALQFPNWEQQGGWRSSGERTDRVGDRSITTVYYTHGGERVAYSIVSQPALGGLDTHGEQYATLREHGRTAVVWTVRNHTCVLSAKGMSVGQLWQLAASTRG